MRISTGILATKFQLTSPATFGKHFRGKCSKEKREREKKR
jgi:hypothetical protein